MKELIGIDKEETRTQIDKVIELVKIINRNTEQLNKKGYVLSLEDVYKMIYDTDTFKQKVYLQELEAICEMFGEDFNVVKTKDYIFNQTDMFHKMAMKKCRYLIDIAQELKHLSFYGDNIFINYIELNGNIASPKLNFQEEIEQYYSHYAQNDKQAKVTKKLKAVQAAIDEVMKLGFSSYQVHQFLNAYNNEINYQKVECL